MAHRKFQFIMPAPSSIVFDAFHYHIWRMRWDSLVSSTRVVNGAPCPYVGAITENSGAGFLHNLSMKTMFVTFNRPNVAAAKMVEPSFPFSRWAASMQHQELGENNSLMIYTYTFEVTPCFLGWLMGPIAQFIFDYQTKRRFRRLTNFLSNHADEIQNWQKTMSLPKYDSTT